MVNLDWCKKQIGGISLIEKKQHLSESYLREAYDSFDACLKNTGKWKVITGYYSCYNALYSILMKCGIKSEIHDCSIKLMILFDFSDTEIKFLEDLKRKKINAQYYLREVNLDDVSKVKNFILRCELILNDLNDDVINQVRERLDE